MSGESSDDEMLHLYRYIRRRRRKCRKYWVHPYNERNVQCRLFVAAKELQGCDAKFLAFYRMSKESYSALAEIITPALHHQNTNMRECVSAEERLLITLRMSKESYSALAEIITPALHHQNTNMRECVSAEERLLITLRYLATGCTFVSLGLYFARGETTVGRIVYDTTKILWNELEEEYMPLPRKEEWMSIAERFESIWNLPNCIGAIDGKHIRIEKIPNTGSTNFNYKSYHSTVLLACCNADGLLTMIETGYAGRNSDGAIFRSSAMKNLLSQSQLEIPPPSKLRFDDSDSLFPFYFVADEVFPLSRHLLRPYSRRVLDNVKSIFNYRLSRGRKTIECVFGMMVEKFQVLNTPIRCRDVSKVNDVVKAVCILHNFLRKKEGVQYTFQAPQQENEEMIAVPNMFHPAPTSGGILNDGSTAYAVRNHLANYFLNPRASLPWQSKYCI